MGWETERLHGLAESELHVHDDGHSYDAVRRDEEAGDTRRGGGYAVAGRTAPLALYDTYPQCHACPMTMRYSDDPAPPNIERGGDWRFVSSFLDVMGYDGMRLQDCTHGRISTSKRDRRGKASGVHLFSADTLFSWCIFASGAGMGIGWERARQGGPNRTDG